MLVAAIIQAGCIEGEIGRKWILGDTNRIKGSLDEEKSTKETEKKRAEKIGG